MDVEVWIDKALIFFSNISECSVHACKIYNLKINWSSPVSQWILLCALHRMENKAMYLHTLGERENGSILEEPFDGKNLSKLNLCDDGKSQEAVLRFKEHYIKNQRSMMMCRPGVLIYANSHMDILELHHLNQFLIKDWESPLCQISSTVLSSEKYCSPCNVYLGR